MLEQTQAISAAELERMMKLQDVILKAMAKRITWLEAAEIIGVCDPTMRRMRDGIRNSARTGYSTSGTASGQPCGYRWRQPSGYWRCIGDTYFDLSVRHFHEKLREEHAIELSYTWVKQALQGAGLVARRKKRARIAGAGRARHCRECCGTLTAASIAGFPTTAITICW
ncbi:MAG: hypothetical protein JO138_08430 [Acidobacteriaceae bacterium]|nr:hypothetical protein [Acidobacteriaceae bacterium]